jgi:Tol biopolymer transport system component
MATGELRLLTTETVIAFFWSPDGRSIAYFSADSGDAGKIEVYAPRRNTQVNINQLPAQGVRASPDWAWTAVSLSTPAQQQFHRFQLSVMDVASGTGLRLLTFQPSLPFLTQFLPFFDQYSLSHRLWSPDSRSLLLATTDNGVQRIFVVPISGGDPRPLSEGEIAFWSHQ